MELLTTMRTQNAVYWPPVLDVNGDAVNDSDGNPTYGTAVDLDVRWEDVIVEFTDRGGTAKTSKSMVYVGEDLKENGVLWKGLLASVPDAAVPFNNKGAWAIQRFDVTPILFAEPPFEADDALRIAYL